MSHTALLVFHYDEDVSNVMSPHHYESEENMDFQLELTKEEAKEEYKDLLKRYPEYKGLSKEEVMQRYHGFHYDEEEQGYGYNTNSIGFYDWHEVGGRFSYNFPIKNKKLALELVTEELEATKSDYRNKIHEYAKLKTMPPQEACDKLELMKNSAQVKNVDWIEATKEDNLCYELLGEGDGMPTAYSKKELLAMIKRFKDGIVTMVDYHS